MEAGDGLVFFLGALGALGGWFSELLLRKEKSITIRYVLIHDSGRILFRRLCAYPEGLKNCWISVWDRLLVSMSLRRFFSASALRVAAMLSTSRARLAEGLEGAALFLLEGRGAS
jgi:hypothetical protein